MIQHLDKAIESFFRQHVPLPEASVDLSFRAPEGSWTASIARPTVDVFLWEVAQSDQARGTGIDHRVTEDGRRQHRPLPKQVAFRYFVTVWAREEKDEHELLGAILRSVLRYDVLPATLLPPAMVETACQLLLASDQHRLPPQLWGGGPIKPGLYVNVEMGVDAIGWMDRGEPVEAVHANVIDRTPRESARPETLEPPPLRKFRSGAALVMEGRRQTLATADVSVGTGKPGGSGESGGDDQDAQT